MEIGKLNRRIVLMEPLSQPSPFGGSQVRNYRDAARVWANRRDENSGISEELKGKMVAALSVVSWLIRRPKKHRISPLWKVRDSDGVEYNIIHVAEIGLTELALKTQRSDAGKP